MSALLKLVCMLLQVSESGIHRPPVAGIAGSGKIGSPSIVLSGGYEDDKVLMLVVDYQLVKLFGVAFKIFGNENSIFFLKNQFTEAGTF